LIFEERIIVFFTLSSFMKVRYSIFFLIFSFSIHAQKKYELIFQTDEHLKVNNQIKTSFKDSNEVKQSLNKLKYKAIKKGYLLAGIDSIKYTQKSCSVWFYAGERFKSIQVKTNEPLSGNYISATLREKMLFFIPFNPKELQKFMFAIHNDLLNNGYPLSSVYLDSIESDEKNCKATLIVNKGKFFTISKIHVRGDSSINNSLVSKIIGVKEGDIFNQQKMNLISKNIEEIGYLKEIKKHELLFTNEGTELFVYVKSSSSSSINGAIGLQPNVESSRIGITGELNLKLINILNQGENMLINWRSIQAQTQALNATFNYPYLFKSPMGIDLNFNLYKRDTTFLDLKTKIGVSYILRNGNMIKMFYQNANSTVLKNGGNSGVLNNLSNVKNDFYGVSFSKRKLDYLPNPSKGFFLLTEFAVGNRKSQLTDTSNFEKSTTYKANLSIEYYLPLYKRHILKIANKTELYFAPVIYQNELYRFGGLQSLRGFNEEEIFASNRSVITLEYRFLLDKNSNIFAFYDQGFYENTSTDFIFDRPFGFGAGLSFGTNLGIFSVSLAIGKQFDNPLIIRNSKIHFGYIAYF